MFLRSVLFYAALSLPGQAMALSCLKPNMGRSFNERAADDQVWVLAEGQILADLPLQDLLRLPPPGENGQMPVQETRTVSAGGSFVGRQLGAKTEAPLNDRIALSVECLSPWCGAFPPEGTPLLAFLKRTADGGLALEAGLCPRGFVERPSAAQVSALRNCLAKGSCGAAEIAAFD